MEHIKQGCAAQGFACSSPYPGTSGASVCLSDASVLQISFAGRVSELSAITSYLFRGTTLSPLDEQVACTFDQIFRVEMRHMNLLAKAIVQLGARPIYAANGPKGCAPWTGCNVDYTCGTTEALQRSISEEFAAIAQYRAQIPRLSQPCLKALLERIIQDEELHIRIFRSLLER